MKRVRRGAALVTGSLALGAACTPIDTGGQLISFHAYASGPVGVTGALEFDTGDGYHVQLTTARIHLGAVYLRLGQSNPGSANSACVGETTYGLQVPGSVDVDLLSDAPQEFSLLGNATSDLDQSAEVWLTEGDLNVVAETTPIVVVAGVATDGVMTYPFTASVTIGTNRVVPPANPAQPGENPICKQRIVAPIPVSLRPVVGGDLLLRIDPSHWFDDVDFETLVPGTDGAPAVIPDVNNGTTADVSAGRAFFAAIKGASADTYQFSWVMP